jgi:hypothetical protein
MTRTPKLLLLTGLVLFVLGGAMAAAGCGSSSGSTGGGTGDGGDAATPGDAATSDTGAPTDAGGDTGSSGDSGGTDAGMPLPPDLNNPSIAVPPVLTWGDRTPCDMHEIQRQDMVNPFPSTPQFTTPGSVKTYTDTSATDVGNTYFYQVRCVVGSVRSAWSNEVSWGHP